MDPERTLRLVVGVVGAGTMGAGIAQVALEAGHEVVLQDLDDAALARGRARIAAGLARRAASLGLGPGSADAWVAERLERVREAISPHAVAGEADLVVEAAHEDLELKRTIFRALDDGAPSDVILATNTSALSVDAIADGTVRPARVLGLHFFNPAPLLPLVEVIRGPRTDPAAVSRAVGIVGAWDRTPIVVADRPGFVVNRVNRPFTLEALAVLESGAASVEAIDHAVRAAGYPMGPFELMDLTGIDISLAAARGIEAGFAALGDPLAGRFRPSPLQEALVAAGRLGRKTGIGFYRYGDDGARLGPVEGPAERPGGPAPDAAAAGAEAVARIEAAIANEAHRVAAEGTASPDDIDLALRLGANHPEGPFERWRGRGGPDALRDRLAAFAPLGERFAPAPGLGADRGPGPVRPA